MSKQVPQFIGSTPIVELTRINIPDGVRIFAKLEFMNPGGSIKDRVVKYILDDARQRNILKPGSVIVENTSGNTGAAIAMLAAIYGYKAILTMPDKVSKEKQDALKAMGAEIVVCPTSALPDSAEHYVATARRIHTQTSGSFMINQYDNPLNAEAHYLTTGPEIFNSLGSNITAFVAAGSTGGTISGTGRFLKEHNPKIKVVLLDPIGSIYHKYFHQGVIDPTTIKPYFVKGVGEDHIAKCMDFGVIDDVIQFDDGAAFQTCHDLAQREGLFCGGSSGANIWGCLQVAKTIQKPATIVTVLPDSGSKYLSKIYNEDWLMDHGFDGTWMPKQSSDQHFACGK